MASMGPSGSDLESGNRGLTKRDRDGRLARMPRPWRIRFTGAKYHVTSRGNGRAVVFYGGEDHERFLEQLDDALEKDLVQLYAYVLMPNHYHLLVETPYGNIQRFMQRLNTAYGMYFRYKHSRPGHCFQGRYGAKLVAGDDYIIRLARYIHLNPVKVSGMEARSRQEKIEYLNGYEWSSYREYAGLAEPEGRTNLRWLELMGGRTRRGRCAAYRRYIERMIEGEDEELKEADAASRYAVGDHEFVEQVTEELRGKRMGRALTGDILWPEDEMADMEIVEKAVQDSFGVSGEELRCHGRRAGLAKAVAVELCCRLTGRSQREVAGRFGYGSDSSAGKQRRLVRAKASADDGFAQRLARIEARVRERTQQRHGSSRPISSF